jgi:hypothetical protein
MANRYWVGGSGTWDAANTANWAASSGGAGGQSVPTAADAVFFDAASGGGTCTIGAVVPCLTLNLTGYTGTLAFGTNKVEIAGNAATIFTQTTSCSVSGTPVIDLTYAGATGTRTIVATSIAAANTISFNVLGGTDTIGMSSARIRGMNFTGFAGTLAAGSKFFHGDLTFSTGMTIAAGASVMTLRNVTSGSSSTLTTNGKTINNPVTQDASGTWVLGDNLTINPAYALTVDAGIFNANGKNVSINNLASSGAVSRTLAIGSGTWTVSGSGTAWNCATATNLTVTGAGVISMTSASAKTFAGGGASWPTLNQGGAGALTISGSNTFANITNTVQPSTITLTAGATQAVSAFGVSGTSGNLITLNSSSAGSQATLSDSSGTNSVSFVSIKDINATGGAIWDAPTTSGNIDAGNNVGWNFGIPFTYDIEFSPALRSFTERKHF